MARRVNREFCEVVAVAVVVACATLIAGAAAQRDRLLFDQSGIDRVRQCCSDFYEFTRAAESQLSGQHVFAQISGTCAAPRDGGRGGGTNAWRGTAQQRGDPSWALQSLYCSPTVRGADPVFVGGPDTTHLEWSGSTHANWNACCKQRANSELSVVAHKLRRQSGSDASLSGACASDSMYFIRFSRSPVGDGPWTVVSVQCIPRPRKAAPQSQATALLGAVELIWGGNTRYQLSQCCEGYQTDITAIENHLEGQWLPMGPAERVTGGCPSPTGESNQWTVTVQPDHNADDVWTVSQVMCRANVASTRLVRATSSAVDASRALRAARKTVAFASGASDPVTVLFTTAVQNLTAQDVSVATGTTVALHFGSFALQSAQKANGSESVALRVAIGGAATVQDVHHGESCTHGLDPFCEPTSWTTCCSNNAWGATVTVAVSYVCDATGAHAFTVASAGSVGFAAADSALKSKLQAALSVVAVPKEEDAPFCPPS